MMNCCFQKGDINLLLPVLSSAKEKGLKLTLHMAEVWFVIIFCISQFLFVIQSVSQSGSIADSRGRLAAASECMTSMS